MKRTFDKLFTLMFAVVMILSLRVTAFAKDTAITFKGLTEGFEGAVGSEYTDTDLFNNFKDVMPGDKLTETIQIKNESTDCDYIKLYLKAEAHDEEANPLTYSETFENTDGKDQGGIDGERDETVATMSDFLAQLSMKIYNGDELIYEATPDELDGLKESVLLGTLRKGESAVLTVELEVPITLDNKYAYRVGEVDWIFKTEVLDDPQQNQPETDEPQTPATPELPSTPASPGLLSPKTGDTSNLLLYIVIAGVAAVGLIFLAVFKCRKDSEEK